MLHIIGYTIGYLIGALIGAALANLIIERQETKRIRKETEAASEAIADFLKREIEKIEKIEKNEENLLTNSKKKFIIELEKRERKGEQRNEEL